MNRFTGTEIAALVFAAVLFFGGASLVIWPQTGVFIHDTSHPYVHGDDSRVYMTATQSRLWGGMAMAFGVGLAAITIYRGNK